MKTSSVVVAAIPEQAVSIRHDPTVVYAGSEGSVCQATFGRQHHRLSDDSCRTKGPLFDSSHSSDGWSWVRSDARLQGAWSAYRDRNQDHGVGSVKSGS